MKKSASLILLLISIFYSIILYAELDPVIIFSSYGAKSVVAMDRITLRRIFTRQETRWSDGQPITVYMRPLESVINKQFITEVLQMTVYRFQTSLESYTYTGKALDIIEVNSDREMLNKINSRIGAIGYVSNGAIIANQKTIKVCDTSAGCSINQ